MKLIETRRHEFFAAFRYPTTTHHNKGLMVIKGRPMMFDKPELKTAIKTIRAFLSRHKPDKPFKGYVKLDVTFGMELKGKHVDGEPHINKPDRDNLVKTLKDCMAKEGLIANDSQDFTGDITKIWSKVPGVRVSLIEYKLIK